MELRGEPEKGCAGRFVLAGGIGARRGVTGEGDVTILLGLSNLIHIEYLGAEYDVAAVAAWLGLRYRTL